MAQNIYDDPRFFEGYSQLARQRLGLEGAPEWPLVRGMLPAIAGKRVVDLGCGLGWVSRWMREQGASSVLALDISKRMIQRARAATDDSGIEYRIADLETLELPEAAFDIAYSSLAFHYVRDFSRLARQISRALAPGGHLVFTIEHPVYMAAARPPLGGRRRRPQDLAGERLLAGRRTPHRLVRTRGVEVPPDHRHDP